MTPGPPSAVTFPLRRLARALRPAPPRDDGHRWRPEHFRPALRTRLLVLQPTPFCNLDCDYCYLATRDERGRMDPELAGRAISALAEARLLGPELAVVWHAGEPLAAGIDFYRRAFASAARALPPGTTLDHCIQTNGVLIDADWCALFREWGVRVGVSLDGPAHVHDAHRRTRSGKGTHARVMAGIEALRAHGLSFHAIMVVTRAALPHADAVADFFLDHGIEDLGLNVDEQEGVNRASSLAGADPGWHAFLARLMERARTSGGRLRLREALDAEHRILVPAPRHHIQGLERPLPDNDQVLPFAIVTVDHRGDYATFSPELLGNAGARNADFVLGNIDSTPFDEALASARFAALYRRVLDGVRRCARECAYFECCGGGAPANKWFEHGALEAGATRYCRQAVQAPLDWALARLERELDGA